MTASTRWDYLIVTASNDLQARAYERQLALRRQTAVLAPVREVMVVADPDGKRVGSGGSTAFCLMQVVNREIQNGGFKSGDIEAILRRLRILIVHAGGDSRRLPAYAACGKIFIPVPGESRNGLQATLFDRLIPEFMRLPPGREDAGQVVMAAGDALILFDSSGVSLANPGLTALCCPATPEHASKHGVFCPDGQGQVRLYLQKPGLEQQKRLGAVNTRGETLLDIGVMSFDSRTALALLKCSGVEVNAEGKLDWHPDFKAQVLERGIDFYREICCALGSQATASHHAEQVRGSGSKWPEADLARMFNELSGIPFYLQAVPECRFLHFGTTRQLITSGAELREYDAGANSVPTDEPILLGNEILRGWEVIGKSAWVEGCRISARLTLDGNNVVVGAKVTQPTHLPKGACLDVLPGTSRKGEPVLFIKCYGIGDTFKDSVVKGATLCGRGLMEWLSLAGLHADEVWDKNLFAEERSLWNARVFPAVSPADGYQAWLWMFTPESATKQEKAALARVERYSVADMAELAGA